MTLSLNEGVQIYCLEINASFCRRERTIKQFHFVCSDMMWCVCVCACVHVRSACDADDGTLLKLQNPIFMVLCWPLIIITHNVVPSQPPHLKVIIYFFLFRLYSAHQAHHISYSLLLLIKMITFYGRAGRVARVWSNGGAATTEK